HPPDVRTTLPQAGILQSSGNRSFCGRLHGERCLPADGRSESHTVEQYRRRNCHRDHGKNERSLERMAIRDVAHQRWRRHVAEKMKDKDVYSDRRGANVSSDGIDEGGIERCRIEEKEEWLRQ